MLTWPSWFVTQGFSKILKNSAKGFLIPLNSYCQNSATIALRIWLGTINALMSAVGYNFAKLFKAFAWTRFFILRVPNQDFKSAFEAFLNWIWIQFSQPKWA